MPTYKRGELTLLDYEKINQAIPLGKEYGLAQRLSAVEVQVSGATVTQVMRLEDDEYLRFGTGTGSTDSTNYDVQMSFDGTQLEMLPRSDDLCAFNIGDGTTDMDVKWFGGSTSNYVLFDMGNAQITLEAVDLHLGDTDFLEFGDAAAGDFAINFDGTNLEILPAVDNTGAVHIGDGTTDADFKVFMGATTASVLFDNSAANVVFTATTLDIGTSGSPTALTAGSPIVDLYSTCSSTSGSTSAEPFFVSSTMTGVGGVGGRARFYGTANVALGGWSNALKAHWVWGASGRTGGLGSAFVAEMQLSAGTTSGAYTALEAELVLGSGASTGQQTSFIYCNATGADASTFDTNGYFMHIGDGITAAAGKFASANYHTLKCYFTDGSTTRYMFLSQIENGVGVGASGSNVSFSQGSPLFQMYSTCSSTNGSNSVEPFYVYCDMTGAAGVGGRARFHMYTNVALGGWSNALKAYSQYGASGSTTGLGSAFCAELDLSAGTSSGTYAPLEIELNCGSSASTGTATSLVYMNVGGTDVATLDSNAYFLHIGAGVTAAATKLVSADYQTMKCLFADGSRTRYMVFSQTENGLGIGVSGTNVSFSQGSPLISMYSTCSSTNGSNSVEPLYVYCDMTGAGGVGGRSRFHMYTNVALGGWSNALKAYAQYGASGSTTGLGSAMCAEMDLSAGTTSGTYAPLELELNLGTGASTGTATSLIYMSFQGDGASAFNSNGFLFDIGGSVADTEGGFFEAEAITATNFSHVLRCRIAGTTYYIGLHTDKDFTT